MSQWNKRPGVSSDGVSPESIISGLMVSRGIDPSDSFFRSAPLSGLSDPLTLGSGADIVANMLLDCRGKNITVIGDYDADGISSSVILKRTVVALGGRCTVFLPSRWKHGYGLNDKTMADLMARFAWKKPDMVFVLDCGSSSEEHIAALKAAGIGKIAIIDHHIIARDTMSLSADAHVNWREFGTAQNMCAAGEVFQVCRLALSRAGLDWKWALPFAAMATVGDAVPVSGDNRIIVRNGADYRMMSNSGSPGLTALITNKCKGGVSQKALSFYVVPRINAAGRMDSPDAALEFLLEEDQGCANKLMLSLEYTNNERKVIQDIIFRSGVKTIEERGAQPSCVFLHDATWNIGVVGISCSQMVDRYGVPAMMFGTFGGKIKGSGRSIPGINLKAILDECGDEVFERYGGHEMACGATVRNGMFDEAKKRFSAAIEKLGAGKMIVHIPEYDMDLEPSAVTHDLGNALFEQLYPYCPTSNPEPVFRLQGGTAKSVVLTPYGRIWSKLNIVVSKNGKTVPIMMSTFIKSGMEEAMASIKQGDVADFYFSYPQTSYCDFGFGEEDYALELVDIVK